MSILVTGGCGFIGSNFIIESLLQSDEAVINLDALTYAGNKENLCEYDNDSRYILKVGSIGNPDFVREIINNYKIRAVVNFAAESHVDRSILGPESFIQTNIVGTYKLLEVVKSYWETLEEEAKKNFRFLHVSTDEVYGSLSLGDTPFTEKNQFLPNSPYSASKAASDHLVRSYCHTYGLPTVTTNCSNNYGPYQFPEKLIPLCILHALSDKTIPVYGDGKQIRDWLYVSDHCRAILSVLNNGRVGEVYNIGGKSEKANIDVVHSICQILDEQKPRADGKSYREQIAFVKDRPGHDRRYAIDCAKIENELNWKPLETFESGLLKTVLWYLNHEQWLANIINGEYRKSI